MHDILKEELADLSLQKMTIYTTLIPWKTRGTSAQKGVTRIL